MILGLAVWIRLGAEEEVWEELFLLVGSLK